MTIAREEIFGAVLSFFVFDIVEEVIKRLNESEYGLAASVWIENIKKGHYIASNLKAGTVRVNDFSLNGKKYNSVTLNNLELVAR